MDKMIEVSPEEYRRLLQTEAKVQSLMAYVNRTRYSVDREIIGGILGFVVNEAKYEESRERNAEGEII